MDTAVGGVTEALPDVPDTTKSELEHEVAFVEDQVRVTELPETTEVGEETREAVGRTGGGGVPDTALMFTLCLQDLEAPAESVTVEETVNVPMDWKVWLTGLVSAEVPSPKSKW